MAATPLLIVRWLWVLGELCGEFGAIGEPEFGQDAQQVSVGGAWGDAQSGGDVPSGQSPGGEFGDLVFPGGQGGRPVGAGAGWAVGDGWLVSSRA